jgi:WD40 repeat protein
MKRKRLYQRKWVVIFSLLLLIIIATMGYWLFYKPMQVNSGIFKPGKALTHGGEVWAVKFSPDGKLIASGSVDSTVKLWDTNGLLVKNFKHPAGVTSLDFSKDGYYIATGSYDGIVRIWKVNEPGAPMELKGHEGTVWSVAFSANGNLASSGEDKTIKIWDAQTGSLIRTLTGHALNIWSIKFSPDGSKIVSGSFDKTIKIWDAASGALLHTLNGHAEAIVDVAISHSGEILASASDDKTIKLWSLSDGKLITTLQGGEEHVQGLDWSPDDKYLISSGRDKPALGELLQNFLGDSKYNKGISMRLWNMTTQKVIQTFAQHSNDVNDVAWSPDGQSIASAGSDNVVWLWRLADTVNL